MRPRSTLASAMATLLAVGLGGCAPLGDDPCFGVDCSGRGSCIAEGLRPLCACFEGYAPLGLECVLDPESDGGSGGDGDLDGDVDTDVDADVDTDVDADVDADTDADVDTDVDSDVDSDADVDSDVDADADTDADGGPDGGDEPCPFAPALGGECDPVSQACCRDGERCTLAAGEEVCVPEVGSGGPGDLCYARYDDDCGAGAHCIGSTAPTVAYCAVFCETTADCPTVPPHECRPMASYPAYSACGPAAASCNPALGTGCPAGWSCQLVNSSSSLVTMCYPAGSHGVGSACGDYAGCVPGSGCFDLGGGSRCYRYCDVDASDCPAGTRCGSTGHWLYGLCV